MINDNEKAAWMYWLNCKFDDFDKRGVICCSNLGLNKQNWIYVLALKNNVIISIPSKKFEYYTNKINVINSQSLVCIADILNILHNDPHEDG